MEVGDSEVQARAQLSSELKANLDYIRPSQTNQQQDKQRWDLFLQSEVPDLANMPGDKR